MLIENGQIQRVFGENVVKCSISMPEVRTRLRVIKTVSGFIYMVRKANYVNSESNVWLRPLLGRAT